MDQKEIKKLMTRVAKGEISEKEAELLINPEKTQPQNPEQEIEASEQGIKKDTRKRTKLNKTGG